MKLREMESVILLKRRDFLKELQGFAGLFFGRTLLSALKTQKPIRICMANNPIWIEKFKISDELKAQFEKHSGSDGKSFLVWCLEHGHLNEDEYLSWASQEFQIPVLSKTFFENQDEKTKWKSTWTTARFLSSQWDNSLLPLEQYEDFVRVGCLEIPELDIDRSVGYVLAPLSGMKMLWEEIYPAKPIDEPKVETPVVPVVAENSVVTTPEIINIPPPPQSAEFDANSLMASWGSVESTPEEVLPETPVEAEEAPQMPVGFAMPEGMAATSSAVDIPIPSITLKVEPKIEAPKLPPIPEVVEQAAPQPQIVVKAKNPPIPPMAPPVPGKIVNDIVGMIELRDAKEKLDDCTTLAEVANHAFAKFSRYFDRHMILLMKGFELRPNVWAGNWNLKSIKPNAINLDQASIFRIVSRTKLPYHGYTKPSVVNDLFFAEWTNANPPAHVTVVPLIVNDQLIGMIMGATDSSLDAKVALMDAERWVQDIAPHVHRTKNTAVKAAA